MPSKPPPLYAVLFQIYTAKYGGILLCSVPLPTELLVPLGVTEVLVFVPLGVTEVDDVIPHASPPVLPAVVFPAACQGAVVKRTPAIAISKLALFVSKIRDVWL